MGSLHQLVDDLLRGGAVVHQALHRLQILLEGSHAVIEAGGVADLPDSMWRAMDLNAAGLIYDNFWEWIFNIHLTSLPEIR